MAIRNFFLKDHNMSNIKDYYGKKWWIYYFDRRVHEIIDDLGGGGSYAEKIKRNTLSKACSKPYRSKIAFTNSI